jgi:arylamine N-acetyltransferase
MPIPLTPGVYPQYSEMFRLISTEQYEYELQIFRHKWVSIYGFSGEPCSFKTLERLNNKNANPRSERSAFSSFFACTLPFKTSANGNGRFKLYNDSFTVSLHNRVVYKKKIDSQRTLALTLKKYFHIIEPDHIRYDEPQMLAYHHHGITHPPFLHRYPTRLKHKYDQFQKKDHSREFIVPDEPVKLTNK